MDEIGLTWRWKCREGSRLGDYLHLHFPSDGLSSACLRAVSTFCWRRLEASLLVSEGYAVTTLPRNLVG